MTKKILLTCAGGFSTSMLVEKMKEEAQNQHIDIVIDACGEGALDSFLPADVILIGPQLAHAEDEINEKVNGEIPVRVIEMMDYGMLNGKKVLSEALDLMANNE